MAPGLGGDRAPVGDELAPCFADRAADGRADLDLAAQELRRDPLAEQLPACIHEGFGRSGAEIPALQVDEQVLLLDADGGRSIGARHAFVPGLTEH